MHTRPRDQDHNQSQSCAFPSATPEPRTGSVAIDFILADHAVRTRYLPSAKAQPKATHEPAIFSGDGCRRPVRHCHPPAASARVDPYDGS